MSKKSRANKLSAANAVPPVGADETTETVAVVAAPVVEQVAPVEVPTVTTSQPVATTAAPTVAVSVKKKRIPMARVLLNGVLAKLSGSVDSVAAYVSGFMALPVGPRKGYDNYWSKEDGFTNPETIMKLTPQGLGKMMAICHHRAALYIAEGGELGKETLSILGAINAYEEIAVANAREVVKRKEIADAEAGLKTAIEAFANARGVSVDEARKAMGAFALPAAISQTVPAAVVDADEETLGESEEEMAELAD